MEGYVSEDNSGNTKQAQSCEQTDGDAAIYLDSLIAQFQGDSGVDFDKGTVRPQPSASGEAGLSASDDESPAQTVATIEVAGEPEQQKNTFNFLLVGIVSIALIAVTWMASNGDGDRHTVSDMTQPVTKASPASVATTPVPSASTAGIDPENAPVEAALPGQAEPTPATAQLENVDPVLASEAAPKSGRTAWVINLTSVSTPVMAGDIQKELGSRGIATERVQVTVGGKSYYRIFVPGFSSKQEAGQARLPFLKESEFSGAWVTRYQTAVQSPE